MRTSIPLNRICQFAIGLLLVGMTTLKSQDLLYDNGPIFNIDHPSPISMLQDESLEMNTYGFNASRERNYRLLDEFILEDKVSIDHFIFYNYQMNETEASTTAAYVQIWKGNPFYDGELIWGDLTTNLLTSAELSGGKRDLESTPGDQSRLIQKITVKTINLNLDPGNYWVDYSFDGSGDSGPWCPPITITGQVYTGNAMQFNGFAYTAVFDIGGNDFQGMPFQVYGKKRRNIQATECLKCLTQLENGLNDTTLSNTKSIDEFSFYPNPVNDVLNIRSNKAIESLMVYNLTGKLLIENLKVNNKIDVSNLKSGIYLFRIRFDDGEIKNFKVIKK